MNQINVEVVRDSRDIMGKFGALYGKQIFTVTKEQCDLKYGSRLQEATDKGLLMPNRPIHRYKILAIDIVKLALAVDASGAPVVIINEGLTDQTGKNSIEIRCPLTDPKLANEVTVQSVADALNKNQVAPVYFSNAKRLVAEVNALNQGELTKVANFIEDIKAQKAIIEKTITSNHNNVDEYYRELDKKSSTDLHVHIEA